MCGDDKFNVSASRDIIRSYYETTAMRGHARSQMRYKKSSDALRYRLRGWLPSDRNAPILDLACGTGELLFFLEEAGYTNLHGVDLCEQELGEAKHFISAELVCADILDYLKHARGPFQCVVGLNILEHLSKDKVMRILKETCRVLTAGGTFIAMVPNAISPFGSVTRHWDYTHEWAFTPNNFQQLAALTGFCSELEVRECGPVPHGLKSVVRLALWKAIKMAIRAYLLVEVADTKGGVYTMDMLVRMRKTKESADAD